MRHFWMAIKHEITELEKTKNITLATNAAVGRLSDRIRALTVDIEDLQSYDNVWKSKLAAKSSNHLTKWIHQLQNPSDCETASKFYWKELEECGIGCVMHQLVRGLDHTMEKTQVLLANFNNSQYTHNGDLEDFPLLPISSCSNPMNVDNWEEYICQSTYCGPKTDKMNRRSDHKLSYIKEPRITKGFAFKPAAISDEVWLEMKSFHGNPRAWISGHMLNYLMRPKPWMEKILDQHEKEIDFSTPIV
uniref:GT23 domain-containing protein n=1 Tax=Ciona savignyi TaxID=51511 RepID=H2ZEC7_CIOSA